MDTVHLKSILLTLTSLPHETEWVEFKVNNISPEDIGEYLSALSNSATLHGKNPAYIVWGVDNISHEILGTKFKPRLEKICTILGMICLLQFLCDCHVTG